MQIYFGLNASSKKRLFLLLQTIWLKNLIGRQRIDVACLPSGGSNFKHKRLKDIRNVFFHISLSQNLNCPEVEVVCYFNGKLQKSDVPLFYGKKKLFLGITDVHFFMLFNKFLYN